MGGECMGKRSTATAVPLPAVPCVQCRLNAVPFTCFKSCVFLLCHALQNDPSVQYVRPESSSESEEMPRECPCACVGRKGLGAQST